MFGFIGATLFGVIYYVSWKSDDMSEERQKNSSKKNNIEFYYDKKGTMRHVGTGKKYTTAEVHSLFFNNKSIIEEKRIKEYKNRLERKYYAVLNPDKLFTKEVFLTYEEAKDYINKCKTDNKNIISDPQMICEEMWKHNNFTYNLHFKNKG